MKVRRAAAVMLAPPLMALAYVYLVPYPVERLDPAHSTSLTLTDRRGEVLRTVPLRGGGRATWVSLDRIPRSAIDATLAGEDHRFFDHPGVDLGAMVRAVVLAARERRLVSGGSTITMQLVRLVEPHPRTLVGKVREVMAALRLERAVSKETILEQYLNRAYYGNGAFGIEQAAQRYFGKPARALGAGQAALLAVLPRAPRTYDPRRALPVALARRAHVLALMEKRGLIDVEARRRIEHDPVPLTWTDAPSRARHFVDWVLASMPEGRSGHLRTTLDLRLQTRLEVAVAEHLSVDARLAQAGLVVVEPLTGDVLAMVVSSGESQVNITTVPRHPGSTLKPFVYAMAIEAGDGPATLANDRQAAIPGYEPRRRMRQRDPSPYRDALAGSFNLAAVGVLHRVGVAPALERLRGVGLGPLTGTAPEYGLDLALGSARVRLVDLAAAYAFLVNGGNVPRIRFLAAERPSFRSGLFTAEASFMVMDILADNAARRAVFGAELPLDLPFRVAAKTGTSSGFADTLTVAATREAVVAAWVGAFDGSGTKGTLAMWSAAPLVRAGMLAVRDRQGHALTLPSRPAGVVTATVCRVSGQLAGRGCPTRRELFGAGRAPTSPCAGHLEMFQAARRGG